MSKKSSKKVGKIDGFFVIWYNEDAFRKAYSFRVFGGRNTAFFDTKNPTDNCEGTVGKEGIMKAFLFWSRR